MSKAVAEVSRIAESPTAGATPLTDTASHNIEYARPGDQQDDERRGNKFQ
jgi:hypothetical protein